MLKDLARRALSVAGLRLSRQSNLTEVRELLARLHPRATAKGLIRVGAAGDGGYLVPDDLAGISACFSPGVDRIATFEADLAARGIPSYMADASVDGPPYQDSSFHFIKKFVGARSDERTMTLDEWVDTCAPTGDLILQMDIEGAEWEVILSASPALLRRFRIIVVELHFLDALIDGFGFRLLNAALRKLLDDFRVVHAHPNNVAAVYRYRDLEIPRLVELTLVRRDQAEPGEYVRSFPHPLDSDNVPERPHMTLPRAWYRAETGSPLPNSVP